MQGQISYLLVFSCVFLSIFPCFFSGMMKHRNFVARPFRAAGTTEAAPLRAPSDDARRHATRRTSTCTSVFFGAGYGRPREVCRRPSRVEAAGEPSPVRRSAWCLVRGAWCNEERCFILIQKHAVFGDIVHGNLPGIYGDTSRNYIILIPVMSPKFLRSCFPCFRNFLCRIIHDAL